MGGVCTLIQFYLSFQFVQLNLYGETISILSVTNLKMNIGLLPGDLRRDPPPPKGNSSRLTCDSMRVRVELIQVGSRTV